MSQSDSPTISFMFPLFNVLIDKVEEFIELKPGRIYENAANASLHKLTEFYAKTDTNILYTPSISSYIY
jgi:hypothetical protein